MQRLQVQVDELLVKLGALLAQLVDDVLEVADADVSADRFEVRHHSLTRERFDFVQVSGEDLHRMVSNQQGRSHKSPIKDAYLKARFRVLRKDPARSVQDDGEMLRSELLQVSHGRSDFFFRIVFFGAHPESEVFRVSRRFHDRRPREAITYRLRSSTAFSCIFLPL